MTRIALLQLNSDVGAIGTNAAKIREGVQEAAHAGANLVATPQLALTGYPLEDLAGRSSFRRAARRALDALAADLAADGLGDVTVLVGTIGPLGESEDQGQPGGFEPGCPTNCAAVVKDGRVVSYYEKRNLYSGSPIDEARIFRPGERPLTLDVDGANIAVLIGEDLWGAAQPDGERTVFGTEPSLFEEEDDAIQYGPLDAVVVLEASPFAVDVQQRREEALCRRAATIGCPVFYVNQVGAQDDLVFDGGSVVAAPVGDGYPEADGNYWGSDLDGTGPRDAQIVAAAGHFQTGQLIVDLDADAHPAAVAPASESSARGRSTTSPQGPMPEAEAMYRACTLGLADYVRQSGFFKKVVLGLSGGIDSALVAAIAADAIGGQNIIGVSMPSSYSSQHSKDDAADTAKRLGADYRVVPIAPIVDTFQASLPLEGVAAENLQARIRGMILMSISNAEGPLCLATGNKSELAVGYSTVYGDAVGGYAPIKDALKSQVWEMARWRNEHARKLGEIEPIPINSIEKPPSAELRPDQLDSDSLPDYDLLDPALADYLGKNWGRADLLAAGHDAATVDLIVRLVDRAEWKRRQYPLGPRVTSSMIGRDHRIPITSSWREPNEEPKA